MQLHICFMVLWDIFEIWTVYWNCTKIPILKWISGETVVILQLHDSLMKALQTHTWRWNITISSYMEKPGHPEKKGKKQLIPTAVNVASTLWLDLYL